MTPRLHALRGFRNRMEFGEGRIGRGVESAPGPDDETLLLG